MIRPSISINALNPWVSFLLRDSVMLQLCFSLHFAFGESLSARGERFLFSHAFPWAYMFRMPSIHSVGDTEITHHRDSTRLLQNKIANTRHTMRTAVYQCHVLSVQESLAQTVQATQECTWVQHEQPSVWGSIFCNNKETASSS